ncbi:MAG: sulfite exporter TauE/SafE family protein [Paracoccaceae bacterium]|nr:sulfite exporter TauE/SafE family protein [Paracoccaceae bacterium]MDG1317497.1 sulfite exporter TauE/SafE family protein [Paracoccaceae bacterium]
MFDPLSLFVISATFIIAGGVKGVIGLGLPTVSLGLLTATLDLPTAMALLIAPSLVTNLYQATAGGHARVILWRIWPFLLIATATVWLGAIALTRVDLDVLSALLGLLLVAYGGLSLAGVRLRIPARSEGWMGLVFGTANGILTGMTGSFAVPGVMYLQGIGLSRDILVQSMGMLFTASTVALAFAIGTNALLSTELVIASLLAIVPSLIGMWAGQNLRRRLSETQFRGALSIGIVLLGIYILISSTA